MLSPDPVTQSPENAQNYDRYTYAFNNPLKFIDPTGYYSGELGAGNSGLFPDSQHIQHTYSWDDFHLDHSDPAQVLYWALHSGALGPDSSAYQVVQASQGITASGAASGGGAPSSGGSLSLGAPPGFEGYSVPTPVFEEPSLPAAPPVPVKDSADDVDGAGDPTGGNACSDLGNSCTFVQRGMESIVTVIVGANYNPKRDPAYRRLFDDASTGRTPIVGATVVGEEFTDAVVVGIGVATVLPASIVICAHNAAGCARAAYRLHTRIDGVRRAFAYKRTFGIEEFGDALPPRIDPNEFIPVPSPRPPYVQPY